MKLLKFFYDLVENQTILQSKSATNKLDCIIHLLLTYYKSVLCRKTLEL